MLEYITAGESHGPTLSAILEGMPSGLFVDVEFINHELWRRQQGFGRGGRQRLETDLAIITGGLYQNKTTGAPIAIAVHNRDFKIDEMPQLFRPRPGHADLAGALKYQQGIREVLERSSARETVMRVAVGGIAKLFLKKFGIEIASHVIQIGNAKMQQNVSFAQILAKREKSDVACVSPEASKKMIDQIHEAMKSKDSIGGKFEVRVTGVPIGLGSYVHYKRKLDARIAQGLMSLQSVKAVEFGLGTQLAETFGSGAHDEIFYNAKHGYFHKTNRAGGITGGMSNGAEIKIIATMKPIATIRKQLRSVDMRTKKTERADFERSDVCAVPAGGVIGEAIVAYEIANAFLEKFGGDSMSEVERNFKGYLKVIK